ncbi:hypothetical protein GMOD_00001266 [Pyrenophora seminiperda CCB06]|uniref:Uncharacterized protein n=1 Tax=Pyrenophora seminiperda CCB06 TaxID=1302712 RepID=A0A3M7LYV1_9PLEO|nr:hypothetical protein GMOD_00001266 [Pyrenophora seminiperda CCB06]
MAPVPCTEGEWNIEVARHVSLLRYHKASSPVSFANWHLHGDQDPEREHHTRDLYADRDQTHRQRSDFLAANNPTESVIHHRDYDMGASTPMSDTRFFYARVMCLYDARIEYIQQEGMRWLATWADLRLEKQKPAPACNERFIKACESTIDFLRDDYVKRKVDFVAEIRILLEGRDPDMAERVLRELVELYPRLRGYGSV